MDARLTEFVSAGEAPGSTFGAHATRHARNSVPWRGSGPHGITRPRQRGGGGQPGRREQPSPVAMFPPGVGRIRLPSQIHPPMGPSLNHGGAPFFFGGGAARCPPPPPVMGSGAHFWGGGQQAAMCPPPQTAMGSGAHAWGGGQHPIAPTSSSGGALFREGGSTPSVSLVSVHDSGGRRDAVLCFSADGSGAVVPLDTLVTSTREPTGGGHRGHPVARAATIRGASPPWRLRSRRPRSARKRPRLQRASC